MNIRSITCFVDPGWPIDQTLVSHSAQASQAVQTQIEKAGYQVQTTRLATTPFSHYFPSLEYDIAVEAAQFCESITKEAGFAYLSLGPAIPGLSDSYMAIPPILAATQDVFISGQLTLPDGGVSLPAVQACGKIIAELSCLDINGFGNLYFAALANVAAGAPFFPAAYHAGGRPAMAFAMEAADLAVSAIQGSSSLEAVRRRLIAEVESYAGTLEKIGYRVAAQFEMDFLGLDFTLAPFPSAERSFGTALEALGIPATGLHGSLAAAAYLADTLDQAGYTRTGFNGLMLPVLEDAVLAARADDGNLSVEDLLMYSAVCGTGLDTVPLPGDTPASALSALLLDIAALAQRLDKPLTARLMPIPGKVAGDPTSFDFPFFANSRVMGLKARSIDGLLAGDETIYISPRPQR
jgi:uncharacterized protein